MTSPVLLDVVDGVATITLNRPQARNALSREVLRLLPLVVGEADGRADVDVLVLTGADPAFCAGLDLKELGSSDRPLLGDRGAGAAISGGPFAPTRKPIVGAVNGVAVTGGLELALRCDFLVASERAKFGDTHSRVGVQPGWGLTVLLPQAIGLRRAREMSFTGNFLDAHQALAWGLVNHVVPHDELLPTAHRLALDIAGNDPAGLRNLRETYDLVHDDVDGFAVESRRAAAWLSANYDPTVVASRRASIESRGRGQ